MFRASRKCPSLAGARPDSRVDFEGKSNREGDGDGDAGQSDGNEKSNDRVSVETLGHVLAGHQWEDGGGFRGGGAGK